MSNKLALKDAQAQNDIDFAGHKPANADLSLYAGANMAWNATTKAFDANPASGNLPAGGTTGQALVKKSNTDFDTQWSSAVAGSGGSRPEYTINVKDAPYNAKGDNVTDDTAAINTALNDLFNAGGGTLFFPKGEYLCNGAFDSVTLSIIKIPTNPYSNPPVAIRLLGEMPVCPPGGGGNSYKGSGINTTVTTGSGGNALLAAGPTYGTGYLTMDKFNAIYLFIENMQFTVPVKPTIHCIRLDTCGYAVLKDVQVNAGYGSNTDPPTADVCGIWMPNAGNWAMNRLERVDVVFYTTGFRFSDHTEFSNLMAAYCITGYQFMVAQHESRGSLRVQHCKTGIKFTGVHPVHLILDSERAFDTGSSGITYGYTCDVDDSINSGSGTIHYALLNFDRYQSQYTPNHLIVLGGANLKRINMRPLGATPRTINLANELAAYWKLDEATGDRRDRHGRSDLSPAGTAFNNGAGILGLGAVFVSANGNKLNCPHNDLIGMAGDFTISAWVKLTAQHNGTIIAKLAGANWEYLLSYDTGGGFQWACYYVGVGDICGVGSPQSLSQWYHVVGRYDSVARQRLLNINDTGIVRGTATQGTAPLASSGALVMGDTMDATIDEIGIWKRQLAAAEITALYNSGNGLSYSGF